MPVSQLTLCKHPGFRRAGKCFHLRVAAGLLFLLTLAWRAVPSAWAEPGTWDVSFTPSSVGGDAIVVQPDGKILTCGIYSGFTRLNADGSPDPGFSEVKVIWLAQAGTITALALQTDGKILIGGGILTKSRASAAPTWRV